MNSCKDTMITSAEEMLKGFGLNYFAFANGQFNIFDAKGQLTYILWATTEKMKVQKTDEYIIGTDKITETLTHFATVPETPEVAKPKDLTILRQQFLDTYNWLRQYANFNDCKLVVAVKLPTGATEIIINTDNIETKCKYYVDAYDDHFCLETNPAVSIVGFMLV